MNSPISFTELLRIFKWDGGTMAQAEAELLRRAKAYDKLHEAIAELKSECLCLKASSLGHNWQELKNYKTALQPEEYQNYEQGLQESIDFIMEGK